MYRFLDCGTLASHLDVRIQRKVVFFGVRFCGDMNSYHKALEGIRF
jgi:hypothetical protein